MSLIYVCEGENRTDYFEQKEGARDLVNASAAAASGEK